MISRDREGINAVIVVGLVCAVVLASVSAYLVVGRLRELEKELRAAKESANILTVVDDFGRTVSIQKYPKRIISLAPSTTEILFAIGAGDLIVGNTEYCDYPDAAKNITKVGGFYQTLNIEAVVGLEPDLVIAFYGQEQEVLTLEDFGICVIALHPETLNGVILNIRQIGLILNKTTEANNLADNLELRVENVTGLTSNATLHKPNIYTEYYEYWTYGPGSFGNDLILKAGGKNIAAITTTAYPMVTSEFVVGSDPEIIILTAGMYAPSKEDVKNRPGWGNISAVKNDKIYYIDGNTIDRPGPRIVNGLEELAKFIHPELFK